jgi:hypothetical protein
VGDLVTCKECGTRYDTDHGFCPRCGSTARGPTLPHAVAVAQRRDPGRRRVQASGVLLLVVGLLFLVSSLIGLAVPLEEVAVSFVEPMADQPGGTLILAGGDNVTYDVIVTTVDGAVVANATGHSGTFNVSSPRHATLHVAANWTADLAAGSTSSSSEFHAIVLGGDTLRVTLGEPDDGDVLVSPTLRTIVQVGRIAFVAVAVILAGGGTCALLLRFWPLAVVASLVGLFLAAIVLLGFLVYGLLFALPFGFAAFFILRGRAYFRKGA